MLNSAEAREECCGNEKSLYHIIRPEINFPEGTDEHDSRVYSEAQRQLAHFIEQGWLVQDQKSCYYLYAQTMNGHTQYGIVLTAHVDDYNNGLIKKHELTRRDKEDDIATITREFGAMDALYIADGHHRSAAAARVGLERAAANPNHQGDEEYNYYLAVFFPADQLTILDYNRVVADLNGMSDEAFLAALQENFEVTEQGTEPYAPQQPHQFSLYLNHKWYSLDARPGTFDPTDPIGVLDVDISSRLILDKLLGITDLRSSKRVDFVGGLRGLTELQHRVDSGEMKAALALYPVTMNQVMRIAETGNIMPPKATWFEPKLRSGVVIHLMD